MNFIKLFFQNINFFNAKIEVLEGNSVLKNIHTYSPCIRSFNAGPVIQTTDGLGMLLSPSGQ